MTAAPDPYPWLPSATVLAWLKVDSGNTSAKDVAEVCRAGAADWVQDQRADLFVTVTNGDEEVTTFTPTPKVVSAALLVAGTLRARQDSPLGAALAEVESDKMIRKLLGLSVVLG